MKKLLAALVSLSSLSAQAAPLSPADAARLEGAWRYNGAGSDACGRSGKWLYGAEMTVEFRLTGGQVTLDDGAEGAGPHKVTRAEKKDGSFELELDGEPGPMRLAPIGTDGLKVTAYGAGGYVGKTFRQCSAADPRAGIKLDKADMTYLATSMLPVNPRFVDARAKNCKAAQYQFLNFDLANPTDPEIRREDSDALGVARNKKSVRVPVDDDGMGRWKIEAAVKTQTGYDFTVTELIPPNGSRGDKSTLSVVRTKDGIAIPAWKRSYLRCPSEN
jgi:hypothetical protein